MLLATGVAGLLFADVAYGLIQLNANWSVGGPIDLGWVVLYATWGAAGLHPSMVALTEPRVAYPAQMGRLRLALLAVSALVAPATLLIEASGGQVRDAPVIAALSALVFLLVLVRLADVASTHRRALAREQGLRHAADALVSATDLTEVRTAVHAAVDGDAAAGHGSRRGPVDRGARASGAGRAAARQESPAAADPRQRLDGAAALHPHARRRPPPRRSAASTSACSARSPCPIRRARAPGSARSPSAPTKRC